MYPRSFPDRPTAFTAIRDWTTELLRRQRLPESAFHFLVPKWGEVHLFLLQGNQFDDGGYELARELASTLQATDVVHVEPIYGPPGQQHAAWWHHESDETVEAWRVEIGHFQLVEVREMSDGRDEPVLPGSVRRVTGRS